MSVKKTGQTKKLLKLLNADDCCTTCPPLSDDAGNVAECRDNGLYVPTPDVPASSVFVADSTNITFTGNGTVGNPISGLYRLMPDDIRDMSQGTRVILGQVAIGGIADGIVPVTKTGAAMTAATITKSGDFDKIAITGGGTGDYISFNEITVAEVSAVVKAKIKVENLNKDGSTGTSWLGFILKGIHSAGDTGSTYNGGSMIELIGKTGAISVPSGVSAYNGDNYQYTETDGTTTGTLVSSGDILEIEMYVDLVRGRRVLRITNLTTNKFMIHNYGAQVGTEPDLISNYSAGTQPYAKLALVASNADYTIYDIKVESSVPFKPMFGTIGDSYGLGYNGPLKDAFTGRVMQLAPYSGFTSNGNGGYIYSVANEQMKTIIKMKPKFVVMLDILSNAFGEFITGNPNKTSWDSAMSNIRNQIASYGGILILVKWPTGGYNFNPVDWNAYVDAQKAAYPGIVDFIDASALTFQYSDNSHPTTSDYNQLAGLFIDLLATYGY